MAKKSLVEINKMISDCGKDTAKAIEIANKYKKTIGNTRYSYLMQILEDKLSTEKQIDIEKKDMDSIEERARAVAREHGIELDTIDIRIQANAKTGSLKLDAKVAMQPSEAIKALSSAISKIILGISESAPEDVRPKFSADFLSEIAVNVAKGLAGYKDEDE